MFTMALPFEPGTITFYATLTTTIETKHRRLKGGSFNIVSYVARLIGNDGTEETFGGEKDMGKLAVEEEYAGFEKFSAVRQDIVNGRHPKTLENGNLSYNIGAMSILVRPLNLEEIAEFGIKLTEPQPDSR